MKKINLNMDIKDIKLFSKKNANNTGKIDYSSKKINLLPDNYYKLKRRKRFITLLLVGFCISLAYFSFYLYQVKMITKWYEEQVYAMESVDGYSGLDEQISNYTEEKNSQDLIFELKKRIDKKSELLKDIEVTNKSIIYILETIENELPNGVKFQSLSVNSDEQISINCEANSNKEIAELIHNLKNTNYFDKVFVGGINKVETLDEISYTFAIECSFGGAADETNQ